MALPWRKIIIEIEMSLKDTLYNYVRLNKYGENNIVYQWRLK
jgi:hypothetical protein